MNMAKAPGTTRILVLGLVLIVLGILAIIAPFQAAVAVVTLLGWLLIVGGALQVLHGLRAEGLAHKLGTLVVGVVMILGGIAVLADRFGSLNLLTIFLAVYFAVEGVFKIFSSFAYRPASGWWAVLVSGALSLVLGLLIWQQWPSSDLWAVGLLVGINLIFTGGALLALSMSIRGLNRRVKKAQSAAAG